MLFKYDMGEKIDSHCWVPLSRDTGLESDASDRFHTKLAKFPLNHVMTDTNVQSIYYLLVGSGLRLCTKERVRGAQDIWAMTRCEVLRYCFRQRLADSYACVSRSVSRSDTKFKTRHP